MNYTDHIISKHNYYGFLVFVSNLILSYDYQSKS